MRTLPGSSLREGRDGMTQSAADGIAPPSQDKRWKLVGASLRRLGHRPQALIEGMHAIQQTFGYLEPSSLRYLAEILVVPLAKVYGVATFYHHFTLSPPGRHTCVVCLGTVCHIKGGPAILEAIEAGHRVKPGGTTEDGALSVVVARCIGACSLAPAVVLDGETVGPTTPEAVLDRLGPCFDEQDEEPS